MKCNNCEVPLSGRQSKFCSRSCRAKSGNAKHQDYKAQQIRGRSRRNGLIESKGGKCQECGYDRCPAALAFHHRDPELKLFQLDVRNCSNRSLADLSLESEKCDLICHNCHMERHWSSEP